MDFSGYVRTRREELGLSLRRVANLVGVDPAYLSRIEAGKVPASDQVITKLAEVLRTDEDELVLLSGRLPGCIQALVQQEPHKVAAALRRITELAVAEPTTSYGVSIAEHSARAIEDGFPFEELSDVAEVESWRKEVYRPIYHVHKWWAQRLGSIFRAAILGSVVPKGSAIMELFYQPHRLSNVVVFDPFMGSGTTVGEAHKLGCTVIGRDINPVAHRAVKTALSDVSRQKLEETFLSLDQTVGAEIRALYTAIDSEGRPCEVLYFFWVKVLTCPSCQFSTDLFPSYIFAKHAYVRRHPTVQILCPSCGDVFSDDYNKKKVTCPTCKQVFDPHSGPAQRTTAICENCEHEFPIGKTAKASDSPPEHRMYAKLVLRSDGTKEYLRATDEDVRRYEDAEHRFYEERPAVPTILIRSGYNTRQILNYGYTSWDQLFNSRQLLAISRLCSAISSLPSSPERDAVATLFSGVLEFNNMFVSFKGEGTGAVRHMFSHHILKPERTPIEANVWGTPKSSGSFLTLFRSRLLRALEYREMPFEIRVDSKSGRKKAKKVYGVNPPMGQKIYGRFPKNGLRPGSIYLSCGSSDKTDLPSGSVDLVITDPPFFDNVHYSELADFFYVWQELYFSGRARNRKETTRHKSEVQDTNAESFAKKLGKVFLECHRVLRDEGLLVFSYHHSRDDGWSAVARAVLNAGFSLVQAQPVKSEMSVASPKMQAKEPIDLDILMVCRKAADDQRVVVSKEDALVKALEKTKDRLKRFNGVGRRLSRNDLRVVLLSQLLVEVCRRGQSFGVVEHFQEMMPAATDLIEELVDFQIRILNESRTNKGEVPQLQLI